MKAYALALLLSLVGCSRSVPDQHATTVRLEIPQPESKTHPAHGTSTHSGGSATCSGTVVAPDVILTAGHCFENADTDAKTLVSGYPVKVLAVVFDGNDHALVRVDFYFTKWAPVGERPEVGTRLHYWGNPAGINDIYREGYVASYHLGTMMVDTNGFFGDSGAGIFDARGDVVGTINFIHYEPHEGLMFTLMGSTALEFTKQQYAMLGM